jgi:hypothetical protein
VEEWEHLSVQVQEHLSVEPAQLSVQVRERLWDLGPAHLSVEAQEHLWEAGPVHSSEQAREHLWEAGWLVQE